MTDQGMTLNRKHAIQALVQGREHEREHDVEKLRAIAVELLAEVDRGRAIEIKVQSAYTMLSEYGDCYATDCPFCGVDCEEDPDPPHVKDECPLSTVDIVATVRILLDRETVQRLVANAAREALHLGEDAGADDVRKALFTLRAEQRESGRRRDLLLEIGREAAHLARKAGLEVSVNQKPGGAK